MIVFNDGRYYQIIEDLECLKKWVTNVKTSHIFCARNVTTYFDQPYNFTIWPEEPIPNCPAMEIYKEYGMWNGITVSKVSKDYTELYWFTKQNAEDGWHKLFIRNKPFLLKFIKYFNAHKKILHFSEDNFEQNTFRLSTSFNTQLAKSGYAKLEMPPVKDMMNIIHRNVYLINKCHNRLSNREVEVLSIICDGFTYKTIARKLNISVKTIQHHVEHIKSKTGLHFKEELIDFYIKNIKTHG
jgi:DNA-binding CsgD family transcriptional regulator